MSSNSRTADPAQVAPFLTHVVSHHGRLTLIPPENAGRVRKNSKVQAKKDKKQSRGGERSARSDDSEEPRFNLGIPRSFKPGSSRRRAAAAKAPVQGRSRDHESGYGDDISIPDYPPPSFQEATSSSVQLPMLSIPPSAAALSAAQSSTTSSPISDCSPTTLMTPSQKMLSIVVEPSSSPQSSPNPSPASASSPSPSAFAFGSVTSQHNTLKPNFRLTPQSATSDSDSDTSLDFVSLPLEPSQRQWEEDRLHGLTLEERVKREEKRQRAAQAESSQQQQQRESDAQPPTHTGLSKCKSQEFLMTDRARGKGRTTLHVPPNPSWRLALDEPSLRSVSSNPSLTQANSKPLSPLSPLRPSSPSSRPYHSTGPASSTISLSLGHLKLPGAFGRSTTSLGAFSSLTNGREGSASKRLFLKGKGKEKERGFSDGELDEREEEALDSWEVIDEEPLECEPSPSTPKLRPRLTLKPLLKPPEISYSTYEEKSVEGKGSVENDTRVDPFPISAESSSPEMERPSSITPTPTEFYPPPTPFSFNIPVSTPTPTSSPFQPTTEIYDQTDIVRRPRYGSIRSSQSPPPIASIMSRQVYRSPPCSSPPPPSPIMRTGPMRAASPYLQTSPSRPSPLSGTSVSSLGLRNPMSVLAPTPIHPSANRRSPPPPPPKSSPSLSMLNIYRPLEGHEVPLPPTPSESDPVISRLRGWPSKSTIQIQRERETEQEVGRLCGYASRPPLFTSSVPNTYTQPSVSGEGPARARAVDYTHVPSIPSRLAVSIPAYSPSFPSMPIASSPATPRSCHYRGRPLPMTPLTPSAMLPAAATQDQNHHCCMTHDHTRSDGIVPEGLLIDFDADIDANTSLSSVATGSCDMDRTTAAVENEDFSVSSVRAAARPTGNLRSLEGAPNAAIASPALTTPDQSQFSEYTDLDLLASRLAVADHDGSDYDALLLVQDFVGPASQTQNFNVNPGSEALSGKIVIERRRVTKDGHVRLKISLLGTVVDKCGACLSQFKEGQFAALGTECQHAFHKKCLRTWLAKSPTCPQCRIPLRLSDSPCMP